MECGLWTVNGRNHLPCAACVPIEYASKPLIMISVVYVYLVPEFTDIRNLNSVARPYLLLSRFQFSFILNVEDYRGTSTLRERRCRTTRVV